MQLYLSLSDEWWLLVWGWISNYFSVASPVGLIPVQLLKDGEVNAKQPLWFSAAWPLQPLMYETLCEPSAAICMGCFPHTFLLCLLYRYVLSNRNRPGSQCRFETLIVNFCQANILGNVKVLNVTTCCRIHYSKFWKSIRCIEVHGKFREMQHRAPWALKCAHSLLTIPCWSLAK